SQLQFAYIAVAPQDCRLYHNGATLMPEHRLMASLCLDSRIMPQQIPATQGFIPMLPQGGLINASGGGGGAGGGAGGGNVGNNLGGGQPFGMVRPMGPVPGGYFPYPAYYGNGFDYQRGYAGMNFPGNNVANLQANVGSDPAAAPAAGGNANNFCNNAPERKNGFGVAGFAGGDNRFAIFGKKPDAKDEDKDKDRKDAKDEEKDKKDAKDDKKPLK